MRTFLIGAAVAGVGLALDRMANFYDADQVLRFVYVVLVSVLVGWLHHARDRARSDADTDGLTGIPNRRAFIERAERQIAQMRRIGTPLTVVYLDIDRFKQVNDTLRHAAGDRVLRCVARTLAQTLRATDAYARVGGDEFVVLIKGNRPQPLIGRVHQALRRTAAARGLDVSFSIGAVTFHSPPESAEAMLRRGDSAMYEAKAGGSLVYRVA